MEKESTGFKNEEYNFLCLYTATMVKNKKGLLIKKDQLQKDLLNFYDDENYHFLFDGICKKENIDNSYVDLNIAFQYGLCFGLLTIIQDTDREIKYLINISANDAGDILTYHNKKEQSAMLNLVELLNQKNSTIDSSYLKRVRKTK